MITNICAGDWIQFQHVERGRLVTAQGHVMADPRFPAWLWVGDRIAANSDGEQSGDIVVLAHTSADRIARAIAEADDNSRPGCVYVKLAEAAMAAGGAK